ncbi:MAG: hypothetical protein KatS3mg102_1039 [Planctomycetota bacterium]|nr:MAG: hypothetical protein KatS3mg102_1039 [Planctomycetota bacterium]
MKERWYAAAGGRRRVVVEPLGEGGRLRVEISSPADASAPSRQGAAARTYEVALVWQQGAELVLGLGSRRLRLAAARDERGRWHVARPGPDGLQHWVLESAGAARRTAAAQPAGSADRLLADMPGVVAEVRVQPGSVVDRGTTLVVLEAMKMSHALVAPARARVRQLCCAPGQTVEAGAELVLLEPLADDGQSGESGGNGMQ